MNYEEKVTSIDIFQEERLENIEAPSRIYVHAGSDVFSGEEVPRFIVYENEELGTTHAYDRSSEHDKYLPNGELTSRSYDHSLECICRRDG